MLNPDLSGRLSHTAYPGSGKTLAALTSSLFSEECKFKKMLGVRC